MNFDNWIKESGFRPSEHSRRGAFEAGQQSQKSKIDCMQVDLDGANERAMMVLNHKNVMVDKMQAKIDELQARIDGARSHVDHIYNVLGDDPDLAKLLDEMVEILKGNKDEN